MKNQVEMTLAALMVAVCLAFAGASIAKEAKPAAKPKAGCDGICKMKCGMKSSMASMKCKKSDSGCKDRVAKEKTACESKK
jgi:hypothetical protein